MELAYLGLFSRIFNWVLDRIFNPVFKWVSDLLSTVFTWIFEELLSPILFPILEEVLQFAIELYSRYYSMLIYGIFSGLLKIIDYIETAFDVFIGLRDVSYTPKSGTTITGPLVEILIQQETVQTVFWVLTLSGFGVAMLLTIFGTAKSAFDLDFENKRPVSKVLTEMMKAFLQFFMVPFFVYFMLILSTDILKLAAGVLTGNNQTTIGRIIFMIASLNAAQDSAFNANSLPDGSSLILGTSPADTVRYPFYALNAPDPKDYTNLADVSAVFNYWDFDYLVGFLASIFVLFVMAVCLITFVQRIFEMILLYIVSPYFVSTMPLDDGERFGRWRDLFIGKCFTGFGSAIGMRLYLLVCQIIMSGQIQFTDATLGSSIEVDYFMKLFFLLGGAWAVFKSGSMITGLISSSAGHQETATQASVGGALYGYTVGKVMQKGKGALVSAAGGVGSMLKGRKGLKADPNQKFEGAKRDRMTNPAQPKLTQQKANAWKKGVVNKNTPRSKVSIGANRASSAGAAGGWKKGVVNANAARSKITIGANRSSIPQIKPGRLAMSKDPAHLAAAKAAAASKTAPAATGMSNQSDAATAYKEKRNFRLGSMVQSTYDANGNHKIRFMGIGVDRDANGNTMACKMPVMNMKFQRTDANQSMQLARMHIPGITRIDSNIQNGQLKYSDISVLHGSVRVSRDAAGTHVGVAGIHGHSFVDGGSGVDAGKLHIRSGNGGDTVTYGSHISFTTSGNHLQSMKLGSLEYSRSGITKKVPPSAVFGSAPSGATAKRTESGTKPGGK